MKLTNAAIPFLAVLATVGHGAQGISEDLSSISTSEKIAETDLELKNVEEVKDNDNDNLMLIEDAATENGHYYGHHHSRRPPLHNYGSHGKKSHYGPYPHPYHPKGKHAGMHDLMKQFSHLYKDTQEFMNSGNYTTYQQEVTKVEAMADRVSKKMNVCAQKFDSRGEYGTVTGQIKQSHRKVTALLPKIGAEEDAKKKSKRSQIKFMKSSSS